MEILGQFLVLPWKYAGQFNAHPEAVQVFKWEAV
jgi:hypothetical protein